MLMDDGCVKWIHDIGRHSYDAGGCHVRTAGTLQDITERKQSEEALAESELKFKTILDAAVDGIVLVDEQTRTFVECNRAFAAMLGYELKEIAALGLTDTHPNEALSEVDRQFQRMTQGKSRVASELPVKRKDGSIFFADMSRSPMKLGGRNYLVAVFHDVTERRQAALALRQERDFTTAVIDSLPGLFALIDEKARLVRWNQNLPKLTGISDEKLQGSDAFGIVVKSDRSTAREKMKEAFKQGSSDVEFRVPAKNGDLRTIYFSGRAITSDEHRYMAAVGIDITERKAAEERLQFANTLLSTLKDTSPDAILVVDADQRIISFNKQFVEMWRLPAGLVDMRNDDAVLAAVASAVKDTNAFIARVRYLYEHPEEAAHEEVELTDGRLIDRHTDVLRTADGRYLGRVWFFRDVTDAKRAEAQIRQMARFDALTGLANRRVFVEALQQAIAWAHRNVTQTFAVLYLDLDHFKDVNDTLGHPIGDLLLQEVGQRLLASVRETDTVARFGGDEFAIILFDIRDPDDAAALADKILKTIGDPFSLQGNVVHSGASVGIAVYGPDSLDAEALLSHADVALYRAKAEGRGTYRFFTDAMDAEVHMRVTMGAELREALTLQQLFLLYQPQVEIETGRIVGVEALVRWRHPKRGVIAPEEFIPTAEKSGLVVALGQWVMREVCRQTRQWLDAGIAPSSVAFNLSGAQFTTTFKLENDIAAILEETGVPPQCLELELTESVLMDAILEHNDVLIRLRQMGLRIAIDDFGTGYSSLDYLRRFPVNRIKIAQTFVRDLETVENTAIVRASLGLARALGIEMIVEGVETLAQLELLRSWDRRYVQGYYFSKPLSASEATLLLRVGKICKSDTPGTKPA
jgi:diguanylate cyclase (GGDEF)-like protein/PAS domain S-box-containing protein